MALSTIKTASIANDAITSDKIINDGNLGVRNIIINGAMQVAQRGTQTGVLNSYGVDRFKIAGVGAQLFTYSQSTEVPSGQGFSYSAKLDVTTADTSVAAGDYAFFRQRFEGQDFQHLKYGTSDAESLTLQFWVRSPKTGTHIVELYHQDAAYANGQAYTITSADTWQKVILTFDGYQTTAITNDNTAGFNVQWWLMAGSTYSSGTLASNTWHDTTSGAANRAAGQVNVVDSTSNDFYITGVQLEVGETATPFEHRSYGDELARCQRYYQQWGPSSETHLRAFAGSYTTGTYISNHFLFPTIMRATPSFAVPSGPAYQNTANYGTGSVSSTGVTLYSISTSTSVIAGFYIDNNNSDYAYADAEL